MPHLVAEKKPADIVALSGRTERQSVESARQKLVQKINENMPFGSSSASIRVKVVSYCTGLQVAVLVDLQAKRRGQGLACTSPSPSRSLWRDQLSAYASPPSANPRGGAAESGNPPEIVAKWSRALNKFLVEITRSQPS